jgi:hypothetical protein
MLLECPGIHKARTKTHSAREYKVERRLYEIDSETQDLIKKNDNWTSKSVRGRERKSTPYMRRAKDAIRRAKDAIQLIDNRRNSAGDDCWLHSTDTQPFDKILYTALECIASALTNITSSSIK